MAVMDKPIVRAAVYGATGLVFLFVSMAFTFPDREVKEIIVVQAEKALGGDYSVRITDLDLWWLTGVTLEGVTIEERVAPEARPAPTGDDGLPEDLPLKVNLSEVSGRLAIFPSLFALAPVVEFDVDLGGGVLEGDVTLGPSEQVFALEFDELDLAKTTAIPAITGVPFFGTLSGEIAIAIDPKQKLPRSGTFEMTGNQVSLGPAVVKTDRFPPMTYFEIPSTSLGTLNIDMAVEAEANQPSKMKVKKFTSNGRDIRTELWGEMQLATHLKRVRPNLEMRLQLDETFVKSNSLAPLLNVKEFRNGHNKDWYGFVLYGTLGKIQFKGSKTAASGPKPATAPGKDAKEAPKEGATKKTEPKKP